MNRAVIVIIGAFIVAVYLTVLNVTYPLIGVDVIKKKNGDVVVSGIYEFGWAKQNIQPNDRVLKINGKHPRSHVTVEKYHVIEQAKTITIQRRNQVQTLRVDMKSHGVAQWAYYIILPTIFFVFTVRFSIFLLRLRPHDKSATVLIYFLLLAGLCYVSASLSAKYEPIGRQLFNGKRYIFSFA